MQDGEIKDIEHRLCREFMVGKKCQFCTKLFNDIINKTGFYNQIENPQMFKENDRKEFIRCAQGFSRTHHLCNKHYKIIRKENKRLNESGVEIPQELTLIKIRRSDI